MAPPFDPVEPPDRHAEQGRHGREPAHQGSGRTASDPGLLLPPASLADRWFDLRSRLARAPSSAILAIAIVLVGGLGTWSLLRPAPAPVESVLPRARPGPSSGTSSAGVGSSGGAVGGAAPSVTATADRSTTGSGPAGGAGSMAGGSAPPADLVVQAAGAVARPGVYRVAPGSRIEDLVRRAGGFGPDADVDRVNLAAPLVDGSRVWLPRRGEAAAPAIVAGGGSGSSAGAGSAGAGAAGVGAAAAPTPAAPVDLNQASAAELDALPGVGPATATAILAYRDQHGRFGSVDELLEVRGIGAAKLDQLRPLVTV